MFKALLICTVVSACAVACTSAPSSPKSASAKSPVPVNCIRDTGSRIAAKPNECRNLAGRTYSQEDIDRTGQVNAGDALSLMDPSVTVHH